ncbi:MAG: four helix bundle protein [Prevotella sp.]|nr:four helix bundle protein [Prevotella sp.]MBR4651049.1 four helix bundle protein [Prevotella sp.]
MTKTFKDIIAWQKAYDYCLCVYKKTENFPDFERFGLRSQFTRAAVSITANIAEGYKKISKQDKLRFLNIAQGSLEECRNYNLLSKDLEYISPETFEELEQKINNTSTFLNAYRNGILNNNGIQD